MIGALPGIWLGSRFAFGLDGRTLKQAVAGLLLVVGGTTLYKALLPPETPAVVASGAAARTANAEMR